MSLKQPSPELSLSCRLFISFNAEDHLKIPGINTVAILYLSQTIPYRINKVIFSAVCQAVIFLTETVDNEFSAHVAFLE